ncbi:nitric oxide reductase [Clostridium tepidiprofundi DSM 19306]|uniref:Nitric oxide reductase n=1 Tax=Clostridium tepidiprofundi DSM 19306 TaxID=1121338 RepID=A0A151B2A1_9CLOT|nr:FprA family A-type flavoprotein [Clostridium tepidiprofundi]KYH34034.1 nitric oxide reductase [Clostridium tepidiprofundi DSM 19306]
MKAVEIKKGIYWVGAIDWDLRNFHGYLTQRGSTYNAYLVIDEKITLIDTVKAHLASEMIERISSIIDPEKIDYIVSNHVEMDHSGALPEIMKIAKNAKIITSPNGIKGLKAHYKKDWDFEVVNSGDTINIGKRNIQFVLTPMVHWPDNMVSYIEEEKIIFSNDAFGQHIASAERFDDEFAIDIIIEEARKYYANIVLPYGSQVQKALEQIKNYAIDIIAPSHGIIWRSHVNKIIQEYVKWSSNTTDKKAVIVYDTMWGSTKKIAYSIANSLKSAGYKTVMCNLQVNHISDIMTELITSEYVCVGSPTLNNNMLPTVAAFLTYMKGLAPKGRKAIVFGSYGWGGQSIGQLKNFMESAKLDVVHEIKVSYIPSEEDLNKIESDLLEKVK